MGRKEGSAVWRNISFLVAQNWRRIIIGIWYFDGSPPEKHDNNLEKQKSEKKERKQVVVVVMCVYMCVCVWFLYMRFLLRC
mmetsp:Transcript_4589/g.10292  ORF Transcript_4589/g.10292 Transcript_4589/m.10292 type:complete len:81 (-) Transcript_4589:151-393(-)